MPNSELGSIITDLLSAQKLAVLATCGNGQPHTSLVAFVAAADLKNIYFATARTTRKFTNLTQCPRVSMLIDSRSNRENDFSDAVAITVSGKTSETVESSAVELYLHKHPYLREFMESPDTALVQVCVERYHVASSFLDVQELDMLQEDGQHPRDR